MCILPHFFSVVKWCNFFYFSSFLASIFFLYFFFLTPCFWVFFVFMQFCGVFSPSTWVSTTTYHIFSLNKYCFCILDFYLKKYTCLSCLLAFISVQYLSELARSIYWVLRDQVDFFKAAQLRALWTLMLTIYFLDFYVWYNFSRTQKISVVSQK